MIKQWTPTPQQAEIMLLTSISAYLIAILINYIIDCKHDWSVLISIPIFLALTQYGFNSINRTNKQKNSQNQNNNKT